MGTQNEQAAPLIKPAKASVRHLPFVVAATTLVSVLPAVLAIELLPSTDALSLLASALLAMALSAVAARAGAAAWARQNGSRVVLFADLMAWSWLHRRVVERRIATTHRRIRDASAAGDAVSLATLVRMGRLLGARDIYTYGHSRRVARHAQNIARTMGLDRAEVERIHRAAAVHDIGKLHTPSAIITKPGRLTDAEFAIVKRHPVDGARMLADVGDPKLVAMVRHHHERLDGRGYPDGLAGDAIPLGARIIAVADTFDALTSTRSYRPAATHKQALAVLSKEAGTQLDERAVAAFLRHYGASRPAAAGAALTAAVDRLLSWLGSGAAGLSSGVASLAQVVPATGAIAAVTLFPAVHAAGVEAAGTGTAAPAPGAVSAPARPGAAPAATREVRSRTARPHRARREQRGARGGRDRARTPAGAGSGSRAPGPAGASTPAASAPLAPSASATAPQGAAPIQAPQAVATAPTATTPAATTPAVTVPPARTPAVTVPAVTLPAVTVPPVETPAVKTPPVTVPAVTTPAVTTPAVTVPSVTVPSVSVPAVPGR